MQYALTDFVGKHPAWKRGGFQTRRRFVAEVYWSKAKIRRWMRLADDNQFDPIRPRYIHVGNIQDNPDLAPIKRTELSSPDFGCSLE